MKTEMEMKMKTSTKTTSKTWRPPARFSLALPIISSLHFTRLHFHVTSAHFTATVAFVAAPTQPAPLQWLSCASLV